jgi:hypothetical protein
MRSSLSGPAAEDLIAEVCENVGAALPSPTHQPDLLILQVDLLQHFPALALELLLVCLLPHSQRFLTEKVLHPNCFLNSLVPRGLLYP